MGNSANLEQDCNHKQQAEIKSDISGHSSKYANMTDEEYYKHWPKIDDKKLEAIYKRLVRTFGWINLDIDWMEIHDMATLLSVQVAQLDNENALFMLSLGEADANYETVDFTPFRDRLESHGPEKTVKFVLELKKNRKIVNCDPQTIVQMAKKKYIQLDEYGFVYGMSDEYKKCDNKPIEIGYYDQLNYDLNKIFKHPNYVFLSDMNEASNQLIHHQ